MRMPAGRLFAGLILLSSTSALAVCNTPPIAVTNVYNIAKNTTVSIYDSDIVANDTDANGDPLSVSLSGSPSTGTWCGIGPTGVCYQPPTNFTGLVAIPYNLSDGCNTVGETVLVFVQ
ncbi:MAG TPA: Ig-like domain-containing protein [Thermoanaerobaculia bacterium]